MKIEGRAWKFGDDISTDLIAPGRYFHLRSNLPKLAEHTFEDVRKDFVEEVEEGDIVVAGKNFGMGSSREHAPAIMKLSGVKAVLAKSFARIFYRNAINVGLVPIQIDTSNIKDGDLLKINVDGGKVENKSNREIYSFQPLPMIMQKILEDDGLKKHVEKHGKIKI